MNEKFQPGIEAFDAILKKVPKFSDQPMVNSEYFLFTSEVKKQKETKCTQKKHARKIIKYSFASGFKRMANDNRRRKRGGTKRESDPKVQVFLNEIGK